jgi:glycerol-3-phosphate acyltransferase PlsY
MRYILTILIGYLLGTFSPAMIIAKKKNHDLQNEGTGNLGATNTFLTVGKKYGFMVMGFDMLKAMIAFRIGKKLLPASLVGGLLGGGAAVLGHVFPFHNKFKGGKGLASLAGTILAYDPVIFTILLVLSVSLVLIVNYSVAMPLSASLLFPVMAGLRDGSSSVFCVAALIGALVIYKHWGNLLKARDGTDMKVREYLFGSRDEEREEKEN